MDEIFPFYVFVTDNLVVLDEYCNMLGCLKLIWDCFTERCQPDTKIQDKGFAQVK